MLNIFLPVKSLIRIIYKSRWFLFFYYGSKSSQLSSWGKELLFQGAINRLYQFKFILRDLFFRKPYKVINYSGEFGPELKFIIPFAYWHHLNGTLKATVSTKHTAELFYFSTNHTELDTSRKYYIDKSIPNSEDHNFSYNLKKWKQVPFKDQYRGQLTLKLKKPLLIISNKFSDEWGEGPINFLDLETIASIIKTSSNSHQIIYNRTEPHLITNDHQKIHSFEEKSFLKKNFKDVIIAEELFQTHSACFKNYNHFQLALYANCNKFISVQGGNSVLCSYFGGTNIVMVKRGHELEFQEYQNFYPKLSDARVILCENKESILSQVELNYGS